MAKNRQKSLKMEVQEPNDPGCRNKQSGILLKYLPEMPEFPGRFTIYRGRFAKYPPEMAIYRGRQANDLPEMSFDRGRLTNDRGCRADDRFRSGKFRVPRRYPWLT
jgi:hypothetical protein